MDSQWLNAQFKNNPAKSKAALARALGLEAPAISKMLNASRQIKAVEYIQMLDFFGLSENTTSSAKSSDSYVLKPLDNKPDGLKERSAHKGHWVMPATIMNKHTEAPPDQIKVFDVKENMMEPDFRKGEHVMVDLTDKNPSPAGVFVVSDGFGTMIRHCEFMAGSQPPKVKISAFNNAFQPQILSEKEFKVIGRVIAKLQWL